MNTTNRRPFEIVPGQRVRITACTHIDLDRGTAKLLCNGLLFDVVRQGQASWYVTATYQYVG